MEAEKQVTKKPRIAGIAIPEKVNHPLTVPQLATQLQKLTVILQACESDEEVIKPLKWSLGKLGEIMMMRAAATYAPDAGSSDSDP